jgi:hypothetical protein
MSGGSTVIWSRKGRSDGSTATLPGNPHPPYGIIRIAAESGPDKDKTGKVRLGKRFLIEQNGQQEVHGGGNVLQKADSSEAKAAGGRSKEQQRYRGRNAG